MQLNWLKQLHTGKKHCAFTDLTAFNSDYFCCFREAKDHLSGDGNLVILCLNGLGDIRWRCQISLPDVDLRDPKLSITPQGELMLLGYARFVDSKNKTRRSQGVCWVSQNGKSWSTPHFMPVNNWWLWRLRWYQGEAYGFAYNRGQQALNLYKGNPRRGFYLHQKYVLSQDTHGLGYPNESDLLFAENGTAYALVRRDADSFTAQLGIAKAPYKKWQWHDLGEYIGGPVMLRLDESRALVAGRLWQSTGPKTALWFLDLDNKRVELAIILPSAGDTSYPGLVKTDNGFLLSYYSSHIDNQSRIYLAELAL